MPSAISERAETVLLGISSLLRNIQSHAFKIQDDMAGKTNQAYLNQKWVAREKPFYEALSLVAYSLVAYKPEPLMKLIKTTTDGKKILKPKDLLDFVSKVFSTATSLKVDPASVSVQAQLQRLQNNQQELTTFLNTLMGLIQTHDAAIQRLQNNEGANRQAG